MEPVSKIRLLDIPSISTDIVDAPCSIEMETLWLLTSFSGALRWRELSSITPSTRFPGSWFSSYTPYSFFARDGEGLQTSGTFPRVPFPGISGAYFPIYSFWTLPSEVCKSLAFITSKRSFSLFVPVSWGLWPVTLAWRHIALRLRAIARSPRLTWAVGLVTHGASGRENAVSASRWNWHKNIR